MFRNYLLVALRNLIRNRISSLVNILGLAIGMAAFVLIIQYVRFELSYDDFHEKQEVVFRMQQDRFNQGEISTQWAAGCSAVYVDLSILFAVEFIVLSVIHLLQVVSSQK